MKRNGFWSILPAKRLGATAALCLAAGLLTVSLQSVTVKGEEPEQREREVYHLPEVKETYTDGEYEFGYQIMADNTVEIVSFSSGTGLENGAIVTIPDTIQGKTVTRIGDIAFYGSDVSGIIIPEGVTAIGEAAFRDCISLSSITIPESVTNIGADAFSGCSSISTIVIPKGVRRIEPYAFSECINLMGVTIPEGVTEIGMSAFADCVNLSNIVLPKSVTAIEEFAFAGCISIDSAVLPEGITIIGGGAFFGCSGLTSVTIPESVTVIDDGAFFGCNALSAIRIPDGVTGIRYRAFMNCSGLTSVTIPKSVEELGDEAFAGCDSITKIRNDSAAVLVLNGIYQDENVRWYDFVTGEEITQLGTGTAVSQYYVPEPENVEVRNFVSRLYTLVLQRDASDGEVDSWTDALVEKRSNGVDAGYGFVFSDECKAKNLSNEDFVEILYNTFMNRPSDEGGKAAWVSQLDAGVDREKVFEGFICSEEFARICADYGIDVGNVSDVGALVHALSHYRNRNADITKFVARCYTQALGRAYEPNGLEAWCKVIIEKSNTPKQVAQNFIFSDEFTQKNLNSTEYVKVLYRTFMGREADEGGLAAWVGVLESGREGRTKVLEGFSDSEEFAEILRSFGLEGRE